MRIDSTGNTKISAQVLVNGTPRTLTGEGNGPTNAFVYDQAVVCGRGDCSLLPITGPGL